MRELKQNKKERDKDYKAGRYFNHSNYNRKERKV